MISVLIVELALYQRKHTYSIIDGDCSYADDVFVLCAKWYHHLYWSLICMNPNISSYDYPFISLNLNSKGTCELVLAACKRVPPNLFRQHFRFACTSTPLARERCGVQPRSQGLSSYRLGTLVGSGHVSPRIWEITVKLLKGGAP